MKRKFIIILIACTCVSLFGCGTSSDKATDNTDTNLTLESTTKNDDLGADESEETEETTPTLDEIAVSYVEQFNDASENDLEFSEDFIPSDKSGAHYRTEFRLAAYDDAIGKSYTFGETSVDIIARQSYSGDAILRVYMNGATLDQCLEIVQYFSPIMDEDITESELQETLDYISEEKEANGYYYADLGLLLLGNDTTGYEFMLKPGND